MALAGWSTTAASNASVGSINWAEGQAPSTVNDSARYTMADVKAEWYQAADLASGSTVNIGAAVGGYMHITGTTTITAFDTIDKGIRRWLKFDGALTLTHNATTLILPNGVNIVTSAKDMALFISEGSGNWRCLVYTPASPAAFSAYKSAPTADVTGAGTTYTVIFDSVIFDRTAGFNNSTGVFTASATGLYLLTTNVLFYNFGGVTITAAALQIHTSNRDYYVADGAFQYVAGSLQQISLGGGVIADMDAGDTVSIKVYINGLAGDTADLYGGAADVYFQGALL